jgi:cellulose synthase/poly-beta-1,6-N-acetylglucosamine synthase-like glycosyltransferase
MPWPIVLAAYVAALSLEIAFEFTCNSILSTTLSGMAHLSARVLSPEVPATPVSGRTSFDRLHREAALTLVKLHLLSEAQLSEATREMRRTGSDLPSVLTAGGDVRPVDYYRQLAAVCDLPFANLKEEPVDASLVDLDDRPDYADFTLLPWKRVGDRVLIATNAITPAAEVWARRRYGANGYGFAITAPYDIMAESLRLFSEWDDFVAREALHAWKPDHSAKATFARSQIAAAVMGVAILVGCLILAPRPTLVVLMAAATTLYTLTFVFKFLLTWVGSSHSVDVTIPDEDVRALSDADLPTYTVLVPMYREAKVLPLIAASLKNLDYPLSRLDVKLVLEEDDAETIAAAKALGLPRNFEIIIVPPSYPKTKPKACNYALQFCRSTFVTIYDAEDQPEPDQLKKAVIAFRRGDERLACVQARLNYFNYTENWLTRMFTLEYSQWFDFLLPGLDALKVPIPLGGTSNHFRLSALRDVGAWDPYNVTEDADLGVRLAQEGFTVGVINSTTYEEANGVLPSWIRQRSRWIKGYMQTWLVHMRHPIQLWRSIGTVGFFGFQFFVGGPPFTMLLNPVMWAISILVFAMGRNEFGWLFPEPFGSMALFNLFIGNSLLVYFGVVAALKRRYFELVAVGLMTPFYWVLHSIAAYKALGQLIRNPHFWEKTEHGTSKVTQAALGNTAENAA